MSKEKETSLCVFQLGIEFDGKDRPETDDIIGLVKDFIYSQSEKYDWDVESVSGAPVCCDDGISISDKWKFIMLKSEHYLEHLRWIDEVLPVGDCSEGLRLFDNAISWLKGYGSVLLDLIERTNSTVSRFVDDLKKMSDLPSEEQLNKLPTMLLREIAAKKGHPNPETESHATLVDWMLGKAREANPLN